MKAGVWIDHRRAVVVVLEAGGERVSAILSQVEKHGERTGDSPMKGPYESAQVPADDSRQRALTGDLNRYYDAVIAVLRYASALVLLGPGEAKGELRKRLEHQHLATRVQAVETTDRMTDAEVAAKVRDFFGEGWSAQGPKQGRANAGLRGASPTEK